MIVLINNRYYNLDQMVYLNKEGIIKFTDGSVEIIDEDLTFSIVDYINTSDRILIVENRLDKEKESKRVKKNAKAAKND